MSKWKKRLVKKIKYKLTIEKIESKRERQEKNIDIFYLVVTMGCFLPILIIAIILFILFIIAN